MSAAQGAEAANKCPQSRIQEDAGEGAGNKSVHPKAWPGFTATRRFRGNTYEIRVSNPDGISKGVKSLQLDGQDIDPKAPIPFLADGKTHSVEALLG